MEKRHTRVIAVGNQKGGVAKTTNCVHIAAALGEQGRKCLICDLDMNHGATLHLGVSSTAFLGAFELLTGEEDPRDVIITNDDDRVDLPPNVDLIPGGRHLEKIDHALGGLNKVRVAEDTLMRSLVKLEGLYDYIFLDTAPNLTLPTIAAYKVADWFILSTIPDPFAITGLGNALTDIHGAQTYANSNVKLLGVVLSCFDARQKLARSLLQYVEEKFTLQDGTKLSFGTTISRSAVVPQVQQSGKTLFQVYPKHPIAEQYRKLAEEVEARVRAQKG